jgi:glycosyltransferase involved in cell wall biosynthesis
MKVSVVGAYYNREAWVAESIRSVLDQSFEDFEFVVVDDGSTDGTAFELSKFDDERLRVIRQSNTGFRLAISRAISESSGEIICIHAAGEIFLPDLLLRQVEIFDSCPEVGCVSVQFRERDGNDEFGILFTDHDFRQIATLLLRMNAVCNGGATMRRSVFESVGGDRKVVCAVSSVRTVRSDRDLRSSGDCTQTSVTRSGNEARETSGLGDGAW